MKCEICGDALQEVWSIDKSIVPNNYLSRLSDDFLVSSQKTYHCTSCQYVKNAHNLSQDEIFRSYSYRSLGTYLDDEVVNFLSHQISVNNIISAVEVGGNNGVFFENLEQKCKQLHSYTIIDKVPIAVRSNKLQHICEFLSEETMPVNADLTIVRHAFAHNSSVSQFATNIVEKLGTEYIYIECADWEKTWINQDFSQLYSEHFYCLSAKAIVNLFKRHGYNLISVANYEIHNGSFGVLLRRGSKEIELEVQPADRSLRENIVSWSESTKEAWKVASSKPFIIWGCSAKLVFLINALDLDMENLMAIFDTTKEKHGRFPPGIPVSVSPEPEQIMEKNMNIVIGAKNFEEILEKKSRIYFPNATIFSI